jgi:hypothetical protein
MHHATNAVVAEPPTADTGMDAPDHLPWRACAFGLEFHSNAPIPGLRSVARAHISVPPDVAVTMGRLPPWIGKPEEISGELWYISPDAECVEDAGLAIWRLEGGRWVRFRFADGTQFVLNESGTEVWASWPEALSPEDTTTYLLGPIAGFLLRLRSTTSLHASIVDIDGSAAAIAGPPGAGKSTTAAAFALAGYPVLTDDLAALDEHGGRFVARPAYPRVRLWPDSAEFLLGDAGALPHLTPNWDKLYLSLGQDGAAYGGAPLPLRVLYLLGPREEGYAAPRVEAISYADAFVELTAHLYTSPALRPATRREDFAFVGRLLSAVPVRRAVPSVAPSRLPQLLEAIVRDVGAA